MYVYVLLHYGCTAAARISSIACISASVSAAATYKLICKLRLGEKKVTVKKKRRKDIRKFIARIKALHTHAHAREEFRTFTIQKGNGRTTRYGIERPMLLFISFFSFYRICVAVQRVLLLFVRAIHTYATHYSKIISLHFVIMKSMPSSSSSSSSMPYFV